MTDADFPHLDPQGRAHMVDVSGKEPTRRRAVAEARLRLAPPTVDALRRGAIEKGDALAVARIAGIEGAKRASSWIPLCHPVRLDRVRVDVEIVARDEVRIRTETIAVDRTGVEMEALTAAAAAALALYDMVKGRDRGAEVTALRLLEKEGGRSGRWTRPGGGEQPLGDKHDVV